MSVESELQHPGPRTGNPLACLRRCRSLRDMPGGYKPAEVIEPNDIHMCQERTYPVDAPAITGRAQCVPVVNRISPELALRTEIIRWNTGDKPRTAKFIDEKELWVGPDIAGIGGHEERKVANQADACCMGVMQEIAQNESDR